MLRGDSEWDDAKILEAMNAGVEKHVRLKEKIPMHIVYFTAWVDETAASISSRTISTGAVDLIAAVEDMPQHLLRLKDRAATSIEPDQDADTLAALRLEICNILRTPART